MSESPVTAAEVMSSPVVAVTTDQSLAAAANARSAADMTAPAAGCDDDRHG